MAAPAHGGERYLRLLVVATCSPWWLLTLLLERTCWPVGLEVQATWQLLDRHALFLFFLVVVRAGRSKPPKSRCASTSSSSKMFCKFSPAGRYRQFLEYWAEEITPSLSSPEWLLNLNLPKRELSIRRKFFMD